jgi:hypothetical protein
VILVVAAAVLLPVRGSGVTLVTAAWSRMVPLLALMVTFPFHVRLSFARLADCCSHPAE